MIAVPIAITSLIIAVPIATTAITPKMLVILVVALGKVTKILSKYRIY